METLYSLDHRPWADQFGSRLHTVHSTRDAIERHLVNADLVIGSILIPGAAAPKVVGAADLAGRLVSGHAGRGPAAVALGLARGGLGLGQTCSVFGHGASSEGGGMHIRIMDADGSNPRQLTQGATVNYQPAVSPDSGLIDQ